MKMEESFLRIFLDLENFKIFLEVLDFKEFSKKKFFWNLGDYENLNLGF